MAGFFATNLKPCGVYLIERRNQIVLGTNNKPVLVPITSLERFRRTLLFQGNPNMRELGGGVTQFSIAGGNPEAGVTQADLGAFLQDEWRIRPNLTFTLGLRYERQTNISSNYNFAPRVFFAWAPGGTSVGAGPCAPPSSSPKMELDQPYRESEFAAIRSIDLDRG